MLRCAAANSQAAPNAFGHGPGNHCIDGVAAPAHQGKQDSQLQDLQGDVSARRIDELWKKGEKKERRLGIEQIDEQALAEDANQPCFGGISFQKLLIISPQRFDSEINQ